MRVVTTTTTVYTLDELDEAAQEKAVQYIVGKLGGDWWDSFDIESITETMVMGLAEQLGTPGHENYGVGDYPGIPGITAGGWDIDRGQYFLISGTLTRENAPKLPWVDGLDEIEVEAKHDHNYYTCVSETLTCEEVDRIGAPVVQAVRDAVHAAWKAGEDEYEYLTSEQRAREWIDSNDAEFTEDGDLYT